MAGYCPRSLFASLWNSTQSAIDIEFIDWFRISISVDWLRLEYSLFEQKIELLYFKHIQLQKLASQLSIGNRRISSNSRAPVQQANGTNDKAKTFVQLTATATLVSLAPEGDGASKRGADNAMVVNSTLTRTTKIYFYFFVTWINKHFKVDVRCFSDYTWRKLEKQYLNHEHGLPCLHWRTIPTFFQVNVLCLNTKLNLCCLNLPCYRIWSHNFLNASVSRGIRSSGTHVAKTLLLLTATCFVVLICFFFSFFLLIFFCNFCLLILSPTRVGTPVLLHKITS